MSHKDAKRQRQQDLDIAEEFLIAAGKALQARFRDCARETYDQAPDAPRPCHTCALNPATNDWPGQTKTILRFMAALELAEPFYCHDQSPKDERGDWIVDAEADPLCAGYGVLQSEGRSTLIGALRAAFEAVGNPAPEGPEADRMLHEILLEQIATLPQDLTSGPRVDGSRSAQPLAADDGAVAVPGA